MQNSLSQSGKSHYRMIVFGIFLHFGASRQLSQKHLFLIFKNIVVMKIYYLIQLISLNIDWTFFRPWSSRIIDYFENNRQNLCSHLKACYVGKWLIVCLLFAKIASNLSTIFRKTSKQSTIIQHNKLQMTRRK